MNRLTRWIRRAPVQTVMGHRLPEPRLTWGAAAMALLYLGAVSYTPLPLPTNREGYSCVLSGALKKKNNTDSSTPEQRSRRKNRNNI